MRDRTTMLLILLALREVVRVIWINFERVSSVVAVAVGMLATCFGCP